MASGDTIFILEPGSASLPTTLFAVPAFVQDASTPNALIEVLRFDPTTAWWANWFFVCPSQYDGGGFTFEWQGGTDNTSTGTLEIELGIVKIADATILTGDLGLDASTRTGISDTPPATPQDKLNYSTTGTITHSNAGSPTEGDLLGFAVTRDVATDTNSGFLQLAKIIIRET